MPIITHGPIVGATTANRVSIWLRTDDPCEVMVRLIPRLPSKPEGYPKTVEVSTAENQDNTGVVMFKHLLADTRYDYVVLVNGKQVLPNEEFPVLSFRTFPEAGTAGESFSFTFGSCFRPHYDGIGDWIFTNLAHGEEETEAEPRFFLMVGDNVYVDDYYDRLVEDGHQPPASGKTLQQFYFDAYRDSWEFPNFRRALMNTPTFMIFDDHEYWNNWGNEQRHHNDNEGMPLALRAYETYQDSHNPDAVQRHNQNPKKYHYTFSYGDVGFFVLDCRTRRNPMALPFRTMLGSEQREALLSWLRDNNSRYRLKFVVSSVPITFMALPSWFINLVHGGLGDQWPGYPVERRIIFDVIKKENISGVHFLSGDIHLGQGVVIKPEDGDAPTVYSFTASPLANTFSMLPEEAPSWASAVSGGLLGAIAGVLISLFNLFNSEISMLSGLFWGILLGTVAGELLRRFLNIWRPPPEHNKPGAIGRIVYEAISKLVQNSYVRRVLGVAKDEIPVEEMTYKPENMFEPVFGRNMGLVTIGKKDAVKFVLLDECGNSHEEPNDCAPDLKKGKLNNSTT